MKITLLTFCCLLLWTISFGQTTRKENSRKGIYGEIVNVPFFLIPVPKGFGLGYEYHFGNSSTNSNIRIGFEYKKLDGNYYNLNGEYNFLFGKSRNRLELGGISHFGFFNNKLTTLTAETFEVETIFLRFGGKVSYVRMLQKNKDLLLRIGLNLLSRDLHFKVFKNDYLNKPGEGDQWIQPHIYVGLSRLF